ncbi:MAG: LysE family translocator, partial [Pseudomonadota bacterium]
MAELALYLPGILAAYAILLVGGFSPGPSVALLLGVGGAQGRHAALVTTLGIVAGSVSLNILTLIGVGVLVEQTAWAVTILRYVGAAYLAWLAYGALRKAVSPPDLSETTPPAKGTRALFATGAALHLTNP